MNQKRRKLYLLGAVLSAVAAFFVVRMVRSPGEEEVSKEQSAVLVSGQVRAIGAGQDVARQIRTVFLILKDAAGGPPYAVTSYVNSGGSDLQYELTEEHIMIPGRPAPENPVVKVRFDADANASTENPGDVVGETSGFSLGQQEVLVEAQLHTGAAD